MSICSMPQVRARLELRRVNGKGGGGDVSNEEGPEVEAGGERQWGGTNSSRGGTKRPRC